MAEGSSGGGGNAGLAFIVGGLVVVIAVIAWFVLSGGMGNQSKDIDVEVKLPEAPSVPTPG